MTFVALKAFLSCLFRNSKSILVGIGIVFLVYTGASLGYRVAEQRAESRIAAAEQQLAHYIYLQQQQQAAIQMKYDTLSQQYEAERTKRQAQTRAITKEIVREVTKPVYRECVVPADGVRLLNAARSEPIDPSEFEGAVPSDSSARRGSDDGQIGGG